VSLHSVHGHFGVDASSDELIIELNPLIISFTVQRIVVANDFRTLMQYYTGQHKVLLAELKSFLDVHPKMNLGAVVGKSLEEHHQNVRYATDPLSFGARLARLAMCTGGRTVVLECLWWL